MISAGRLVPSACVGIPPPKYIYAAPSSSMNTAGSNIHTTSSAPGVAAFTSGSPIGSTNGPVGESETSTPMPAALSAK